MQTRVFKNPGFRLSTVLAMQFKFFVLIAFSTLTLHFQKLE